MLFAEVSWTFFSSEISSTIRRGNYAALRMFLKQFCLGGVLLLLVKQEQGKLQDSQHVRVQDGATDALLDFLKL